jgi:hypothetical protein
MDKIKLGRSRSYNRIEVDSNYALINVDGGLFDGIAAHLSAGSNLHIGHFFADYIVDFVVFVAVVDLGRFDFLNMIDVELVG